MIRFWSQRTVVILAGLALSGASQSVAQAQGNGNLEGFTVAGKGAAGAKPNRLEIDLEISAASEMSADVIVKYRDAKKRINEAFANLKMKDVSVEEKALAVDKKGQAFNPYMMDTPPSKRGKVEVQLTRKLVVQCGNIRDMDEEAVLQLVAKLLDVAQDAGAKVGPQNDGNSYFYYRYSNNNDGLVRFVLDDFDALQDKAYQAAVEDAQRRAGRLAKLSHVTLGPVLGVHEMFVPGEKVQVSNNYYEAPAEDEMPRKRIEAAKFREIPVRVELLVRFGIDAPKAATREAGQ